MSPCGGDGDRQPTSAGAATVSRAADQLGDRRGKPGAAVGDLDPRPGALRRPGDHHRPVSVLERVGDEVADGLDKTPTIAQDNGAVSTPSTRQ
jgi:hypothetical protein